MIPGVLESSNFNQRAGSVDEAAGVISPKSMKGRPIFTRCGSGMSGTRTWRRPECADFYRLFCPCENNNERGVLSPALHSEFF